MGSSPGVCDFFSLNEYKKKVFYKTFAVFTSNLWIRSFQGDC